MTTQTNTYEQQRPETEHFYHVLRLSDTVFLRSCSWYTAAARSWDCVTGSP